MNWRPGVEKPSKDELPAVLATEHPHDVGYYLVEGIYVWSEGKWMHESDPLTVFDADGRRFWWIPEAEIMATLPQVH